MSVPKKIINLLEKAKVNYKILEHKTVFTAFDKSQTLKVPPRIVGKTLLLKGDKELFLCLIPADKNLDLKKVKKVIKKKKVELATERTIKNKLKGAKPGAIPPFGNLWKIKTLVEKSLKKENKIILNSGTWNFSIEISPKDLSKLVEDLVWASISKKK